MDHRAHQRRERHDGRHRGKCARKFRIVEIGEIGFDAHEDRRGLTEEVEAGAAQKVIEVEYAARIGGGVRTQDRLLVAEERSSVQGSAMGKAFSALETTRCSLLP